MYQLYVRSRGGIDFLVSSFGEQPTGFLPLPVPPTSRLLVAEPSKRTMKMVANYEGVKPRGGSVLSPALPFHFTCLGN